ncbi:hypothetical protein ACQCT3_08110 [Sutcliffiella horikoshii]|uniref:hypothetical protein n=1 Tax=Sutcliffiella horikoshii TaxID=79883 RepID=UPI003CF867D4
MKFWFGQLFKNYGQLSGIFGQLLKNFGQFWGIFGHLQKYTRTDGDKRLRA